MEKYSVPMSWNTLVPEEPPPSPSEYDLVCRVCLKRGRLQSIYSYDVGRGLQQQDLSERVRLCSGLRLSAFDGFPANICRACFTMLTVAFNFRQLCLRSDNALRSSVKTEDSIREMAGTGEIEETDDIEWNAEEQCYREEERTSDIDSACVRRNDALRCSVKTEKSTRETEGSEEIDDLEWIGVCSENAEDQRNVETKNNINSDENELYLKAWDGVSSEYFYCLVCGAEFKDREAVVGHTQKEHLGGPRAFKCYGCGKELETRWARELHEDLDCPNMPPGTKYRCRVCGVVVRSRAVLDLHRAEHQGGEPPLPPPAPPRPRRPRPSPSPPLDIDAKEEYMCEGCGQVVRTKACLRDHRKRHRGLPVSRVKQCPECPFRSAQWGQMAVHRLRHSGRRPFACTSCPFRTDSGSNLKVHLRRHSGERPFRCHLCPHRAINSGNLASHMATHKQGRHKCVICNKFFASKETMEGHVAFVHEGRKLNSCTACGGSFATRRGLRRHRDKHCRGHP